MIKQAIIPLAGLGTRLLPLTSVIQKELLPINGKPNLEYIMEECVGAGIKQFIFVVPKSRSSIKKYFFILYYSFLQSTLLLENQNHHYMHKTSHMNENLSCHQVYEELFELLSVYQNHKF